MTRTPHSSAPLGRWPAGRVFARTGLILASALFCLGCRAAPKPGSIEIRDTPRILTFGIDARDYDEITGKLAASILTDPKLSELQGKVLALGPIDNDACIYRFDRVTFAERLQTLLLRSGKNIKITFLENALESHSAAKARYDMRLFDWIKKSEQQKTKDLDEEFLAIFGELPDVDYLIFGRLSCQISQAQKQQEVVYRYNWKIGSCRSGLLLWTDEKSFPKSGRLDPATRPDWLQYPRGDSPLNYYVIGRSDNEKTENAGREAALAKARFELTDTLNATFGLTKIQLFKTIKPEQLDMEVAPYGEFQKKEGRGIASWVLARVAKPKFIEDNKNRQEALQMWSKAEDAYRLAKEAPSAKRRELLANAIKLYQLFLIRYPLEAQSIIQTEFALDKLADLESRENGNPCAARAHCQTILTKSVSGIWKAKAEERLKQLICGEEEQNVYLWRKEFDGQSFAVVSAVKVDGQISPLAKFKDNLAAFLTGVGGVARSLGNTAPPERVLEWGKDTDKALAFLADCKLDFMIILIVDGKMNTRANPQGPTGTSVQFAGNVQCRVFIPGKERLPYSGDRITGWNPYGLAMCLDVLALNELNFWKKTYLEMLAGKP